MKQTYRNSRDVSTMWTGRGHVLASDAHPEGSFDVAVSPRSGVLYSR